MDIIHCFVNNSVKIPLSAIQILLQTNYWILQPPQWIHHLDHLHDKVNHDSNDQDHLHPQTTRSEGSHKQQIEEEYLAL